MPDLYKIEMIMEGRKESFGESYIQAVDQQTVDGVANDWQTIICPLRTACLGKGYSMVGLRVSLIRFANGTPVTDVVAPREFTMLPDQGLANPGGNPNICVNMLMTNTTTKKKTTIKMGGIPDNLEINGGVIAPDDNGWSTRFNSFVVQLQARVVGWIRQEASEVVVITNYVQDAGGQVTFTFAGAPFDPPFPGDKDSVRVSGLNNGSELNRQLVIRPTGLQTFATVKPYFVAPFRSIGQATFYDRPFSRALLFQPIKIGRRKRGRSLFSSRGRAKAQIHG